MRKLAFILLLFLFFFVHPTALAAKKRVRTAPQKMAAVSVYSTAKLSRATRSIVITFLNLSKIKRIDYTLSYSANGISQGVMGSFVPAGQGSEKRDLYFGTCSKGVCTPHYGITNASLVVTTTLTNGRTHTKRYVIKRI